MPVGSIDPNQVDKLLSQNQPTSAPTQIEQVKSDFVKSPAQDTLQLENNDNSNKKLIYGLGGAAALILLGILGYKGHLGEGIQKFLGGAKEAAKEETTKAEEKAKEEVKKTFKELYSDAIKNKKESIKNETTGRTHKFEYDKDGKLIKETVSKGDDYAVYENVKFKKPNGEVVDKIKIVELKKGDNTTMRALDENGVLVRPKPEPKPVDPPKGEGKSEDPKPLDPPKSEAKPKFKPVPKDNFIDSEVPILSEIKPRKVFDGEPPIDLTQEELKTIREALEKQPIYEIKGVGKFLYSRNKNDIWLKKYKGDLNTVDVCYDLNGKMSHFHLRHFDSNNKCILKESFMDDKSLFQYQAITKDGLWIKFNKTGKIDYNYGKFDKIL